MLFTVAPKDDNTASSRTKFAEQCFCNAVITPIWVNHYPEYCSVSGTLNESNIGTYTCTVSLNENSNGIVPYTWEDGTTDDFTITWKINATLPVKADEAVLADKAKELVNPIKVDGVSGSGTNVVISHFGICATASSNTKKIATIAGFVLENGSYVAIRFTQAQPAVSNVNPFGTYLAPKFEDVKSDQLKPSLK